MPKVCKVDYLGMDRMSGGLQKEFGGIVKKLKLNIF